MNKQMWMVDSTERALDRWNMLNTYSPCSSTWEKKVISDFSEAQNSAIIQESNLLRKKLIEPDGLQSLWMIATMYWTLTLQDPVQETFLAHQVANVIMLISGLKMMAVEDNNGMFPELQ